MIYSIKPIQLIIIIVIFDFVQLTSPFLSIKKYQTNCKIKKLKNPRLSQRNTTRLYKPLNFTDDGNEHWDRVPPWDGRTKRSSTEIDLYKPSMTHYSCPGETYPDDYEECCDENQCCPAKRNNIFGVKDRDFPYLVAIYLLLVTFFTLLTLIICCSYHKCPLYNYYKRSTDNLSYVPSVVNCTKNSSIDIASTTYGDSLSTKSTSKDAKKKVAFII